MALSNQEVINRIKEPKHKDQLLKAQKHEQWLRFHAQEALKREWASIYRNDFEVWVQGLLPSDKSAFFLKMMNYPLYTNELCTTMQDEFNKVFDSQNSSFTCDFTNESLQRDFLDYLDEESFWDKWTEAAKGSMLKRISSICVVDMPKNAGTETRPYFYYLDIGAVVDMDYHSNERTTTIEMLIYKQGEEKILVLDELSYRGFVKRGGNWVFEFQNMHDLGYCPACFFWNESINKDEPIVKKSPITGALNNLDYLLFSEISRRCLETYASFPIVVAYKEKCTYYQNIDNNKYECKSGYLDTPRGQFACPVCEKNRLLGAGTVFKITPPRTKDDPNNIDAVKFISPDITGLDYWATKIAAAKEEIYEDCVGNSAETTKQAMNKDQIAGNVDEKQNIIMKVAGNITPSTNFVLFTIARLRYESSFIDLGYNYGNRFYLQTAADAQTEYGTAVTAKMPVAVLAMKRKQVVIANTKGNPVEAQYMELLEELEPWADYNITDAKALGMMEIAPKDYLLKADFSNRIRQFESEYGSIVEFGSKIPHKTKIERIKEVLLSYGAQVIPPPPQPPKI